MLYNEQRLNEEPLPNIEQFGIDNQDQNQAQGINSRDNAERIVVVAANTNQMEAEFIEKNDGNEIQIRAHNNGENGQNIVLTANKNRIENEVNNFFDGNEIQNLAESANKQIQNEAEGNHLDRALTNDNPNRAECNRNNNQNNDTNNEAEICVKEEIVLTDNDRNAIDRLFDDDAEPEIPEQTEIVRIDDEITMIISNPGQILKPYDEEIPDPFLKREKDPFSGNLPYRENVSIEHLLKIKLN